MFTKLYREEEREEVDRGGQEEGLVRPRGERLMMGKGSLTVERR